VPPALPLSALAEGDGHGRRLFAPDHRQLNFFAGLIGGDGRRQFFHASDRLPVDRGDDVAADAELATFDLDDVAGAVQPGFCRGAGFDHFLDEDPGFDRQPESLGQFGSDRGTADAEKAAGAFAALLAASRAARLELGDLFLGGVDRDREPDPDVAL
jgi:hypothetical protein